MNIVCAYFFPSNLYVSKEKINANIIDEVSIGLVVHQKNRYWGFIEKLSFSIQFNTVGVMFESFELLFADMDPIWESR